MKKVVRRIAMGAAVAAASSLVAGCGLKGPLTMPEQSTNVVIRGPGAQGASGSGSSDTAAPTTAQPAPGSTPGETTKPAKGKPAEERLPPPPLPGGNPGSVHGG